MATTAYSTTLKREARISATSRLLTPLFISGDAMLRIKSSVVLDDYNCLDPDLKLIEWRDDFYHRQYPKSNNVLLLIEVSGISLDYDRNRKLPIYARFGIPEVWIENIRARAIETYRNPINGKYAETCIYRPGETISPIAFPDLKLPVSHIMGSGPS